MEAHRTQACKDYREENAQWLTAIPIACPGGAGTF